MRRLETLHRPASPFLSGICAPSVQLGPSCSACGMPRRPLPENLCAASIKLLVPSSLRLLHFLSTSL
eukprot:6033989-Amphidinium_carterae.1